MLGRRASATVDAVINISQAASVSNSSLSNNAMELLSIFKKLGLVPKELENTDNNLDTKEFINLAVEAQSAQWEKAGLQSHEILLFQNALSEVRKTFSRFEIIILYHFSLRWFLPGHVGTHQLPNASVGSERWRLRQEFSPKVYSYNESNTMET